MNSIYNKALLLRLKGYSYNEINQKLSIPKSTLSSWFCNIKLSDDAISRLKSRVAMGTLNGLVKRNKLQTILAKEKAKNIRLKFSKKIKRISKKDLIIIGTALYWAEGYKRLKKVNGREITAHMIAFTNSDAVMVRIFILFLQNILNISSNKIFIETRLFPHISAIEAIKYWMNITKLDESQFYKPTYPISRQSQSKRPTERLPYGTVRVIVSDTESFYKLLGFIDGLQNRIESLV